MSATGRVVYRCAPVKAANPLKSNLLSSWFIAVRSLGRLRPGEFMVLLVCVLAAQNFPMFLFALHWPIPAALGLLVLPLGALYWIGRRRAEYARRKVRRLGGEEVCLDCGYLVREWGIHVGTNAVCPECGRPLMDHTRRASVNVAEAFVFPDLEYAASDTQAHEWFLAAQSSIGWLGRHRLGTGIGALMGVGVALGIMLDLIGLGVDVPDSVRLTILTSIVACSMAAFWGVECTWHRRTSRALTSIRSQSV